MYERKCRSLVLWAEIGESSLIGPELVQETIDKVVLIKEKLKVERDRQKSCADNRHKLLEFEVGERVIAKSVTLERCNSLWEKGQVSTEIEVDKTLRFIEEPVENSYCEVMSTRFPKGGDTNHDLSRFDNQSIECDRLIGIGFLLDFIEFISFPFSDKEMILVIEAVSR
ncbi:hypothetical protein Tco_1049258 [Tanacetum coccineum]